jgi:hypothetical protein
MSTVFVRNDWQGMQESNPQSQFWRLLPSPSGIPCKFCIAVRRFPILHAYYRLEGFWPSPSLHSRCFAVQPTDRINLLIVSKRLAPSLFETAIRRQDIMVRPL